MKTSTTNNGANVSTYSFQPLTKGHRTADHYLDTWIRTMQNTHDFNVLYGRIVNTGVNYIVKGYDRFGEWTVIPCANISTAKLYLGQIMSEPKFRMHSHFQR